MDIIGYNANKLVLYIRREKSMGYYNGFDMGFGLFETMFFLVFFIILGVFIVGVIKSISQWSYNNKQPILDVQCRVITKRTNVTRTSGHNDANGHYHAGTTSTTYYITFEFESKDRMEFMVSGREYGSIIENDCGKLKFQGTRFLEFNRDLSC